MNEHPDTHSATNRWVAFSTRRARPRSAYWDTVRSATGPHLAKLSGAFVGTTPVQVGVAVAVAALSSPSS